MMNRIYQSLLQRKAKGQKSFAVLIDPDKVTADKIDELTALAIEARVDYRFVGGQHVCAEACICYVFCVAHNLCLSLRTVVSAGQA